MWGCGEGGGVGRLVKRAKCYIYNNKLLYVHMMLLSG